VNHAQLLAATLAARPEGYFDAVCGLLDRAVALQCETDELLQRQDREPLGSERAIALAVAAGAKLDELAPLWELLHLAPDQKSLPPPRPSGNVVYLPRSDPAPARREGAARRKRAYRKRLRENVIMLAIPVRSDEVITALIESEHLTAVEALDRREIAGAAAKVLHCWARHWLEHGR
jgi:hypothetical protein